MACESISPSMGSRRLRFFLISLIPLLREISMPALLYRPTLKKYVRLPVELSRRNKVTKEMKDQFQALHDKGWGYKKIGRQFNVRHTTVMYHLKPLFRFQSIRSAAKRSSTLWAEGGERKKRKQAQTKDSRKRIHATFPPDRRYRNQLKIQRRKQHASLT